LRDELKESGISVTCLLPGATDTAFFARADMLDTRAVLATQHRRLAEPGAGSS
jgi:short-subunit dehydrogenase